MNYLKRLLFALAVLFGATALAQSSPQTFTRIRDGALPNNLANVYQFQITFPATYFGLLTASGTYFYDGTSATFRRWWGSTAPADGVLNTAVPSPYVQNFPSLWNATSLRWNRQTTVTLADNMDPPQLTGVGSFLMVWDGAKWDRWSGGPTAVTLGDAMGAAPTGAPTAAYNTFFNGTNFQRWTGEAWDTTMTTAPVAPFVNALSTFYNVDGVAGTRGYQLNGETMDTTLALSAPVAPYVGAYNLFYNGSGPALWTGEAWDTSIDITNVPGVLSLGTFYDTTTAKGHRLTGISALPTSLSPPPAPWVGAVGYNYDYVGGLFHPVRADSSGNTYVLQAALTPGQDSVNDWTKTRTQSVEPLAPTKTTTATVDATGNIVILASIEVLAYSNLTITVKNTGGVNSLDNIYVDVAPDGAAWTALTIYPTDVAPGGIVRVISISNNSDRYLRVRAAATAAVTTSTDCWLTGRVSN